MPITQSQYLTQDQWNKPVWFSIIDIAHYISLCLAINNRNEATITLIVSTFSLLETRNTGSANKINRLFQFQLRLIEIWKLVSHFCILQWLHCLRLSTVINRWFWGLLLWKINTLITKSNLYLILLVNPVQLWLSSVVGNSF